MKSSLLKKLSIVTALCFAISAFAGCPDDDKTKKKEFDQGHAVKEHQIIGGYNAPARIDVKNDFDMNINASFIFWQAKEKGLDFLYAHPTSAAENKNKWISNDFDFKPGFKVGLGVNFDYDNWDLNTEYTWLYLTDTKTKNSQNGYTLYPTWSINGADQAITEGKTSWKLRFNVIDLELARSFYAGTNLTLRPHFGLRGGWIYQKNLCSYSYSTTTFLSKGKQKNWLIGPRAGVVAHFLFDEGFRFQAETAFALFYEKFKTTYKDQDYTNPTGTLAYNLTDRQGYVIPNLDTTLGLAWGTYLDDKNFHLDFLLAYDFSIFWNQNMMRSIVDKRRATIDTKPEDLVFQGLTLTVKFDF